MYVLKLKKNNRLDVVATATRNVLGENHPLLMLKYFFHSQ